ncbi:MAG: hypothetical protein LC650_00985 [Actinobacteria bacterium]|nr:hypothetical protein [Actinomycetota bacterium]
MITTDGKVIVLRGLTAEGQLFAQEVAFGVDPTPATLTDERLGFEVVRSSVDIVDYDESSMQLSVRASIPDNFALELHEVGLIVGDDRVDDEFTSQMLSYFNQDVEWTGYDSINTADARIGGSGLQLDLSGGTKALTSAEVAVSWTLMQAQDRISLAYNRLGGAVSGVFRARVDASNYREYAFSPGSGYGIETFTKADFTETGTAAWADIADIYLEFTGADSIVIDGLRTEAVRAESETLVARTVLTSPVVKASSIEMQVDYRLGVDFV